MQRTDRLWSRMCRPRLGEAECAGVLLAGRPVPLTATVLPDEVEHSVDVFLHNCVRYLLSGGGRLRIAGNGWSERLVYQTLGIGMSRLRSMHVTARVCGQVFCGTEWPVWRGPGVAVVLEAPIYGCEPPSAEAGGVDVLVGHEMDWRAIGVAPDWMLAVEDEGAVRRRLEEEAARVERLTRGTVAERRAVLLNANGMDAPGCALPGFVSVAPGWVSIAAGQWLAREIVGQLRPDVPEVLVGRWERVRELRMAGQR